MKKKYILILSVMAIGIFALGVHLATVGAVEMQIGDTTFSFLPLIISSKAQGPPAGVLYVFSSTTTTTGDLGGRSGAGSFCQLEDHDAHFCNVYEIEEAMVSTGVHFSDPFQTSWVDFPQLLGTYNPDIDTGRARRSDWYDEDYPSDGYGNCGAWSSDNSANNGATIWESGDTPSTALCDQSLKAACCKQMP